MQKSGQAARFVHCLPALDINTVKSGRSACYNGHSPQGTHANGTRPSHVSMSLTKSTVYSTQQILNQLFDAGANTLTIGTSEGGTTTVAVAAGTAADTVVKAAPGRLCRILVTATGTNPLQVVDNATVGSGTVIGCLPASPVVGTTYTFNFPASNGITVKGSASNPGVTISYS